MHLYQIGKLIGTGSFGEVFACKNIEQNQFYVAKKMCLSQMDERGKQNIQNELRILQTFRHLNIVAFKDSFINQKGLYIIMTYCQGGDLYNKIRKIREKGKMFSQSQILDWLVEMSLAIYYLHNNRILHRDLKSQNIFLQITENGQQNVRIGDFGIAKVMDENQDLTATTAIGSPYYMAPQIFNRNIYSYKSDIWALGCILYELCNLRTPFDAQSRHGLMMKVMKGSYPSITPSYSKQLRDLIIDMLQKKSSKRPSIVDILKKPFVRCRVQKYIRIQLEKTKRPDLRKQHEFYMNHQSLKKQGKLLDIDIQNYSGLTKNSSISSMGEDLLFTQEQRQGFIDHKRSIMLEQPRSQTNWNVVKKKRNVILQRIQQQRYNIGRFKLIQDYSMDDYQQQIQQELGQIEEQQQFLHEKQFQASQSVSFDIEQENNQQFQKSKTYIKIFNQLQVLKNTCQNALGMHKYVRASQIIQRGGNKSEIIQALGQGNIGYWHLLQQAMFYESMIKQNSE